jgi:chaperonin GroES
MASKKMSTPKIEPTAGYVLLEPVDVETKTDSGIYLPESAGEKPQRARVLAVGPALVTQKSKVTSPAKKGDVVIYKKWGGNEVKVGTKEYLFAKFEDILAIVK